jgi:hypothetical protein
MRRILTGVFHGGECLDKCIEELCHLCSQVARHRNQLSPAAMAVKTSGDHPRTTTLRLSGLSGQHMAGRNEFDLALHIHGSLPLTLPSFCFRFAWVQ